MWECRSGCAGVIVEPHVRFSEGTLQVGNPRPAVVGGITTGAPTPYSIIAISRCVIAMGWSGLDSMISEDGPLRTVMRMTKDAGSHVWIVANPSVPITASSRDEGYKQPTKQQSTLDLSRVDYISHIFQRYIRGAFNSVDVLMELLFRGISFSAIRVHNPRITHTTTHKSTPERLFVGYVRRFTAFTNSSACLWM